MTYPTLHLNGTSADRLLESYMLALAALGEAERAVDDCMPNARDYYPQGPTAFQQAGREHVARLRKLREVIEELKWIAEDINRQKDERTHR